MNRLIPRVATTSLLATALLLASAAPASAHDGLLESSPAPGSTVTAQLDTVSLTFSDDFLTIGDSTAPFAVQVKGPDDAFYNLGCVQLDGSTISTDVAMGASGLYQVLWQVVSSDGHTTSDDFTFTYESPEGAVESVGRESGVTCDPATGEAIDEATATDAPAPVESDAGSDNMIVRALPWVLGGLAALGLGAAGVFLQYNRARRRSQL